jgi:hypothetical protein
VAARKKALQIAARDVQVYVHERKKEKGRKKWKLYFFGGWLRGWEEGLVCRFYNEGKSGHVLRYFRGNLQL